MPKRVNDAEQPTAPHPQQPTAPNPEPDLLRIEQGWREAIRRALRKGKPAATKKGATKG
jgi:hypothetical protein